LFCALRISSWSVDGHGLAAAAETGHNAGIINLGRLEHGPIVCYRMCMRPWREVFKVTVIVTLAAIFVLVGILVWAFLFFRKTL